MSVKIKRSKGMKIKRFFKYFGIVIAILVGGFLVAGQITYYSIAEIDPPGKMYSVNGGEIPVSNVNSDTEIIKSIRPLPFHNIGVFGIFIAVGIMTFFLALGLEVDKNTAFLAAAGITGALSGGYFVYMKK